MSRYPILPFSHIAREVSETCRTPLESGFERYIGLDHIDPESLRIRRWGWIAEDNPTFTKVFRAGQLLFGRRRAYQRKVAIAEFDGVCSGDIIVMEANPDTLVPELLPFIVQSEGFYQHALSTSAGSLSPRTRWSDLARYELSLPPLSEQRRIADLLWAAEDTIEAWHSCYFESKRAYTSILTEYVEKPINPKYADLSMQIMQLGDVLNVKHGFPFQSEYFADYSDGLPILVTPGNFSVEGGLYFTPQNTKAYLADYPTDYRLRNGDLVVVMTDLTREARILGNPAIIDSDETLLQNQRIGKIEMLQPDLFELDFIRFMMETQYYKNHIKSLATGSTVRHTSPSSIRRLTIVVPQKDIQTRAIQFLQAAFRATREVQKHITQSKDLSRRLKNHIIG